MRVFMLGWEFPPFISGGLGTACYGLTRALSGGGTDVTFVMPRPISAPFSGRVRQPAYAVGTAPTQAAATGGASDSAAASTEFHLDEFRHVTFHAVEANMAGPYARPAAPPTQRSGAAPAVPMPSAAPARPTPSTATAPSMGRPASARSNLGAGTATLSQQIADPYAGDLFDEVERYAKAAAKVAERETFDVVHAHDWMTFPAAAAVAARAGVPMVAHVHSTEFDRAGDAPDPRIVEIERAGLLAAHRVIAVSHLTKAACVKQYGVDPEKIDVVYNAPTANGTGSAPRGPSRGTNGADAGPVDYDAAEDTFENPFAPRPPQGDVIQIEPGEKLVLFLGRLTGQKGPEYFLAAAKKVLEEMPEARFVLAGDGDLAGPLAEQAVELGIAHRTLFAGFLNAADVEQIFAQADLYVMPSVSEPFGIASLEAMSHGVPTIVSKQSGVTEVVENALKVDFWDTDGMADKMVAVLRHPPLAGEMGERGGFEVRRMKWDDAAAACLRVYEHAGVGA